MFSWDTSTGKTMHVTFATCEVRSEHRRAFVEALLARRRDALTTLSIDESRFTIIPDESNPNRVYLFEACPEPRSPDGPCREQRLGAMRQFVDEMRKKSWLLSDWVHSYRITDPRS